MGFGISTPEQAAKDEQGKDPAFVRQITGFVRPLAEAIHGARR